MRRSPWVQVQGLKNIFSALRDNCFNQFSPAGVSLGFTFTHTCGPPRCCSVLSLGSKEESLMPSRQPLAVYKYGFSKHGLTLPNSFHLQVSVA